MASTHLAPSTNPAAGLLDHPVEAPDGLRHRMPRQTRGTAPLLGVTAMTAALSTTGFGAATPASAATPNPAAAVSAVAAYSDASTAAETATQHTADPGLALAARIQQQADGKRVAEAESARIAAARSAATRLTEPRPTGTHPTEAGYPESGYPASEYPKSGYADAAFTEAAFTESGPARPQAAPVRTAATAAAPSAATAVAPLAGYTLARAYGRTGTTWADLHTGIDLAAPAGTPVRALAGGTVTAAGWTAAHGYRVIQTLPDGTELWYCHLSRITVPVGPVAPGTRLGGVGATGNATTPHLHLEVRPAPGQPIDPLPWLNARGLAA